MGWVITKDNIASGMPDDPGRVGARAVQNSTYNPLEAIFTREKYPYDLPTEGGKIAFRLRDEDMEVHYEGVMDDDPDCINQLDASKFGEIDTGAFICEVWRNGEWVMEVG